MKVLFIYNPHSGPNGNDATEAIETYIKSTQHTTHVFETKQAFGPIEYLVESKEQYDVIVSIGGDGTISKTIDGMIKSQTHAKLVIIPMGSTNEFAQSLGIHFTQYADHFSLIDGGTIRKVDVGKINNKHFCYIACFGNFTSVTYKTPQKLKNSLGHFAYWLYGAFKLRVLRNYEYIVSVDGFEFQGNYLFGAISNAYRFGRVFAYDKSYVELDDGYFEVLLVKRPKTAKKFLQILYGMLMEDYSDEMFVKTKADKIKLISKKHRSWNLDGEFGGKSNEVEIEVLKERLEILV